MRVVLDSNVIVAAFATHGVCHEIYEYCLRNSSIICSDFILEEVERILVLKIKYPPTKSAAIVRYLKCNTRLIVPENTTVESRDPNDHMIIATALSGEADYLISGDKDLLVLKKIRNIPVLSPREFWIQSQTTWSQ